MSIDERIQRRNKDFLAPSVLAKPCSFELRKKKRVKELQRSRMLLSEHFSSSTLTEVSQISLNPQQLDRTIMKLLSDFSASPIEDSISTLKELRNLASKESAIPAMFTAIDITEKLLVCVERGEHEVRYESLWILVNLTFAFEDYGLRVVERKGIEVLSMVVEKDWGENTSDLSMWALNHLVIGHKNSAEIAINGSVFKFVVGEILKSSTIPIEKIGLAVWLLSNLILYTEPAPEYYKDYLSLSKKIFLLENEGILHDCISGLNKIVQNPDWVERVIELNYTRRILSFLSRPSENLLLSSLRFIGSLFSMSSNQTASIISLGTLDNIFEVLTNPNLLIKREVLRVLCIIAKQGRNYCEQILAHHNFELILNCLNESAIDIKIDSLFTLKCVLNMCGDDFVFASADRLIDYLVNGIKVRDYRVAGEALECCGFVFLKVRRMYMKGFDGLQELTKRFQESGGLEAVEKLVLDGRWEGSSNAHGFIEEFFMESDKQKAFEFS